MEETSTPAGTWQLATDFDPWRDRATWVLLISALALYLLHLARNSFLNFGHDVPDHLFYVYYIYKHGRLPAPYEGRECYHMPLYYIIAAGFCWLGTKLGMEQPFTLVRFISTICWFGYIYFCILFLKDYVKSRLAYYLVLSMMLFSPMSVVSATQILNETPLTMCQLAGFFHLMRWWKDPEPASLRRALIWNSFGIAFKTSGGILTLTMLVTIAARKLWKGLPRSALVNRQIAVGVAFLLVVGGAPLARNFYFYRVAEARPESLMISSALSRLQTQLPPHPAYYFFGLDVEAFVSHPYLEGSKYATPFIWNMTLKTAILTKRAWRSPWLGTALSVLLLLLLLHGFWSACSMLRGGELHLEAFPLLFFVVFQLVLLMVFRALYYLPATSDYRYVYAITAILGVFFARSLEWHQGRSSRVMVASGALLGGLFVVSSVALVLWQAVPGA